MKRVYAGRRYTLSFFGVRFVCGCSVFGSKQRSCFGGGLFGELDEFGCFADSADYFLFRHQLGDVEHVRTATCSDHCETEGIHDIAEVILF